MISTCPDAHFGRRAFKKTHQLTVCFGLWAKKFQQGCPKCILHFQKHVMGYNFPEKLLFMATPNCKKSGEKSLQFEFMFSLSQGALRWKIRTGAKQDPNPPSFQLSNIPPSSGSPRIKNNFVNIFSKTSWYGNQKNSKNVGRTRSEVQS